MEIARTWTPSKEWLLASQLRMLDHWYTPHRLFVAPAQVVAAKDIDGKVDAELGPALNGVTRGNIDRFQARGRKLVMYQGWADTLVAPAQRWLPNNDSN